METTDVVILGGGVIGCSIASSSPTKIYLFVREIFLFVSIA